MESALDIVVNGQKLFVPANTPLINSLRSQGIPVPGLCYHRAVKGSGSCGLCLVEVYINNRWKMTRACLLKPSTGLQVRTDSPKIKKMRAVSARLLINQGPFKDGQIEAMLRKLIQEGDLHETFQHGSAQHELAQHELTQGDRQNSRLQALYQGCIRCGLCVRICTAYGKRYLTFGGRGKDLNIYYVAPGNDVAENLCGTCHACRSVCPVGYIDSKPQDVFFSI